MRNCLRVDESCVGQERNGGRVDHNHSPAANPENRARARGAVVVRLHGVFVHRPLPTIPPGNMPAAGCAFGPRSQYAGRAV